MMSFFISFFITLLFGSLLSFLEEKLVKQDFVMKSGFLFRLLNVLEVIAPFKHFNKLREFVQMKLPPGFPVKLGKMTPAALVALHFQNTCTYSCSMFKTSEFWTRTLLHNCVAVHFRRT